MEIATASHTSLRVFIVEDQEITRLGLRLLLEKSADIQILGEADNGETAVEAALRAAPDVILMDVGLPGIDGIEATRRIKESNPKIKVVMLTTHDRVDDVFAALSAGADGYCLKETKADAIISAMRVVMDGAVSLDASIARTLLGCIHLEAKKKPAERDAKFGLSPREMDILELLVEGLSNQEMADRLVISAETVKTHMRLVMEKLMVADRTQAAVKALREGLLGAQSAG
jgi:NarL family two-component system response regulator LiaR